MASLIRRAADRGHTQLGWLDSWHSFSFGRYRDPQFDGFGPLRVINDDRVTGGGGFGTHPHREMEIITLVLDGALEHRDSLGHRGVLRAGQVQAMSAGTGIEHSEVNASATQLVHFLQIWIEPQHRGQPAHYADANVPESPAVLLAGPDGTPDALLQIRQDAKLWLRQAPVGSVISHTPAAGRRTWVHVISGNWTTDQGTLGAGDAVATDAALTLTTTAAGRLLLFDLP